MSHEGTSDHDDGNFSPAGENLPEGTDYGAAGLTLPAGLDVDTWRAVLARLGAEYGRADKATQKAKWALGDALAYGEDRKYGETYKLAAEATGLTVPYLYNLASVSKKVARDRRRPELSWRHHRNVADQPSEVQEELLARAASGNWSSDKLQDEKKEKKEPQSRNEGGAGEGDVNSRFCSKCKQPWPEGMPWNG